MYRKVHKEDEMATTEKTTEVKATQANILTVLDKCRVCDYPLAKIRDVMKCTWSEAADLRHAALKASNKK
jgi:hypothetical protein